MIPISLLAVPRSLLTTDPFPEEVLGAGGSVVRIRGLTQFRAPGDTRAGEANPTT
jgi:hypothetical protein